MNAVWVQDWVGLRAFTDANFGVKYHWRHDMDLYPNLASTIAGLESQGIRFLGYFNPFVAHEYGMFETAAAAGWLIEKPTGEVYDFPIITFSGSLVDVFDAEAADWFKYYAHKAVDLGMRGWMSDFGEWLPYDARTSAGTGATLHNLYPTRWHELSREVLADRYPDGDFVLLTRSGFTGEGRVAQIVWGGDQEADFSESDGIATAVRAGLTMGLSGVLFYTHDIAGFSGGPSTEELFLRWVELGAFTPVMRTHDGLRKLENIHFDSTDRTRSQFKRFADIHAALGPYWQTLAQQALDSGVSVVRHPFLLDLNPQALSYDLEWAVGEDIILAPVVEAGADTVAVWLPEGEWTHAPTGTIYQGGQALEVDAPIGSPAVFVRLQGRAMTAEVRDAVLKPLRLP